MHNQLPREEKSSEIDTFHIVHIVKTYACNQKPWTNSITLVIPNYGFIVVHPFENVGLQAGC